ncbi:MAG: hypothetical protein KC425_20745, partial [Anaerolineales bacterium]|nr:hypothetical protein [Anaerolineales bacterium]
MNLLPGPHDTGTAISLLLWRPDEWRLLPLIWEQNVPGSGAPHTRPFHADAVDAAALDLTLAELYRDGWQLQGQL